MGARLACRSQALAILEAKPERELARVRIAGRYALTGAKSRNQRISGAGQALAAFCELSAPAAGPALEFSCVAGVQQASPHTGTWP
jgi:hypothetical protein